MNEVSLPTEPDQRSKMFRDRLSDLIASLFPGSRLVNLERIGKDEVDASEATEKGTGYGLCFQVTVRDPNGAQRHLVFHTADSNEFDHDRRSDRARSMLLAFDTFSYIPQHARAVDVGAVLSGGRMQSLCDSEEFYLLTEFSEGTLYADDLRRIGSSCEIGTSDLARADELARYLAALHRRKTSAAQAYVRSIRNLVGDGEGIFGIIDSYPTNDEIATPNRLQKLEASCSEWRWKLRGKESRGTTTHGDFHPFNILFDEAGRVSVLDASRGCYGDPADDVICLAINYIFFALEHPGTWSTGFGRLWSRFWKRYLEASDDSEILEIVPPFLAWRTLVLANPKWYPATHPKARDALLRLAEGALEKGRFDPEDAEAAFR